MEIRIDSYVLSSAGIFIWKILSKFKYNWFVDLEKDDSAKSGSIVFVAWA